MSLRYLVLLLCVPLFINLIPCYLQVIVAHRLATIVGADQIVVLNDGTVEAIGDHASLLNTSPLYQKLYSLQYQEEHTVNI